ncbi:MAG TPA: hypothetical protein PK413_06505 [Thermoanaerobaculia bacterium]|nr:hypothetical protein [Thermoanaerobaculia bacterium]
MNVYVGGDVRGIQDFIFASPRLLEMRGASAVLRLFDHEVVGRLAKKHGGTKIFAGGGNFLVSLPASSEKPAGEVAKPFLQDAKAAFFELTGGHEIVVEAWAEGAEGFAGARERLDHEIRLRKRQPTTARALASFPFLKRCESCAREEADVLHGFGDDEGERWIGPSCWAKRQMHVQLQRLQKTGRCPGLKVVGVGETLLPSLPLDDMRLAALPKTFQELAGDDDLGLVVADGNGLGEMFQGCSLKEYEDLSERVDRALKEALGAALLQAFGADRKSWRAQVLICGGDDLVVALPARKALGFARELIAAFRVPHRGKVAGMAAGVVFAKPGFPFRTAHELAEELLRGAKAHCRRSPGRLAALDFHRVLGTNVQDLAAERRALLPADDDGQHESWSYGAAGPYDADELDALQTLAKILRRLPRSQLGRLRQILSPRDDSVAAEDRDSHWRVPRRVLAELRSWRSRQEGLEPTELAIGTEPDSRLIQSREEKGRKGPRNVHRWVLADALRLAEQGEV